MRSSHNNFPMFGPNNTDPHANIQIIEHLIIMEQLNLQAKILVGDSDAAMVSRHRIADFRLILIPLRRKQFL